MTTVFTNARVFQSRGTDVEPQFKECMIVKSGVIHHVGTRNDEAVEAAINAGAAIRNVNGKTILPGFVDGHLHLLLLGQSLTKAGLEGCKNLDDIRTQVKEYAVANPEAKRIFCRGWMHSMTPDGVDASMLDDLDPRPIFIDTKDLHSTWCNSAGLAEICAEMNVSPDAPDPAGGTIQRDAEGRFNGLFNESAVFETVWPFVARVASMDDKKEAIKAAVSAFSAAGYTGMIDMAMDDNIWEPLMQLKKQGELKDMRIAAYWLMKPTDSSDNLLRQLDHAIAMADEFNAETWPDCRVVGIKMICDGIIDACTAALKEPYTTGANSDLFWTEEQLDRAVGKAHAAGLQVALHAIGDRAINLAINALEKNTDKTLRPRVEHIEMASADDAKRLGQLGITASIQPVHADPAILRAWPKLLGEHRCGRAFPYREFADGGATLALGSDAPTAPHLPLPNLYVGTTRRSYREPHLETVVNPEYSLTVCQAVAGATFGSAYSCFADKWTGSLQPGLKADFVVCDVELAPERLIQGVVQETWFEGRLVYNREQS